MLQRFCRIQDRHGCERLRAARGCGAWDSSRRDIFLYLCAQELGVSAEVRGCYTRGCRVHNEKQQLAARAPVSSGDQERQYSDKEHHRNYTSVQRPLAPLLQP